MKIAQSIWKEETGWISKGGNLEVNSHAELVLVFGEKKSLTDPAVMNDIRREYPRAYIGGCSTGGEILGEEVCDSSVVVTAVQFEGTKVQAAGVTVESLEESHAAGQALAEGIPHEDLVYALVLGDGLAICGSRLVQGLNSKLPPNVTITGGLAGDGTHFGETYVCVDGIVARKRAVIIGFYGDRLKVGYGSLGGWDQFGLERRITRSKQNVLYEIDGRSALELYKQYLGPYAAELPVSAAWFPLTLRNEETTAKLVRGCIGINESDQSMTFAGDMPEGGLVTLTHANFDRLIDGASTAAQNCVQQTGSGTAELAFLVSCVGRRIVLGQRTDEEVEAVSEVLGPTTFRAGFYSYGEIAPLDGRCALHNETMTVTTLSERS